MWAAGDVASWTHVGVGRRLRLEHRTNAREQGQHVARAILGSVRPFAPVPFFWTDHYNVKVQVAGSLPEGADQTTLFEDPITGAQVIGHHEEGRLVGVVGWNAPAQMLPYRRDLAAGMAHATARRAA